MELEAHLRSKQLTGKTKLRRRQNMKRGKSYLKHIDPVELSDEGQEVEQASSNSTPPVFPFTTKCRPRQFPDSSIPFIDSHCHIDYLFVRERHFGTFKSFVESKDFPKNFSGCVANFCDPPAWGPNQMYEDILAEDGVWGAFGLHPHNASLWSEKVKNDLIQACRHSKCVALGEMGLDLGRKTSSKTSSAIISVQKRAFTDQILLGLEMKKPFIIHGRGAEKMTFEILKENVPIEHKIHFHCYGGDLQTAKRMIDHFPNMFIGVTGLLTYPSASKIREVVKHLPLERLLVETDAPFMRPKNAAVVDADSPKISSPGMGLLVAVKLAEVKKIEIDNVLIQIRKNVSKMYDI
ncbi:hypothetical protein ACHWQZ_G014964 [Mnemiopsis leidyi]